MIASASVVPHCGKETQERKKVERGVTHKQELYFAYAASVGVAALVAAAALPR